MMGRHDGGHFHYAGLFEPEVIREPKVQMTLDLLAAAFQQVMDRRPPVEALTVEMEHVSLAGKLEQLRGMMRADREMEFSAAFVAARPRCEAAGMVLARLRLISTGGV